jgi:hypothetical protein
MNTDSLRVLCVLRGEEVFEGSDPQFPYCFQAACQNLGRKCRETSRFGFDILGENRSGEKMVQIQWGGF